MYKIIGEERYHSDVQVVKRGFDTSNMEHICSDRDYFINKMKSIRENRHDTPKKILEYYRYNFMSTLRYFMKNADATDFEEAFGVSIEELKNELLGGYWCIVTRSKLPKTGTPWRRVGGRSFNWLVPAVEAFEDQGRRVEDDIFYIKMFSSRKEGLNELYKK